VKDDATIIQLTPEQFQTFLQGLAERDERLESRSPGDVPGDDNVDEYVFSAHVEALWSDSIDGDVWGTLEDLELDARDEDEAWEKIKAFYLPRACVLLRAGEDEYVIGEELARRLKLL